MPPELSTADVAAIALTARKRDRLKFYRDEWMKHATNLGKVVRDCRDDPLRPWEAAGYKTFLEFAQEEWSIGVARVYQLCSAEDTRDELKKHSPEVAQIAEILPDRHLRELASVPKEKRVEVLQSAIQSSPTNITAKTIRRARGVIIDGETGEVEPTPPPAPKKTPHKCPTCGQAMP